jgi:hypothetical protein
MKLKFYLVMFLFTSCATKNMWVVSQDNSGGTIAYQNYDGVSNSEWFEDVKKRVQCPDAFIMRSWERKSKTLQRSLVIPTTNTYTTNSNSNYGVRDSFGSNVLKLDGETTSTTTEQTSKVIPYTEEIGWVEHRYDCDLKKYAINKYQQLSTDEKIQIQREQCLQNKLKNCMQLYLLYSDAGKEQLGLAVAEKICGMKDKKESPLYCLVRGGHSIRQGQIKEAVAFFKKGCDVKESASYDEFAEDACAYFAAHTNKLDLLEENISAVRTRCSLGDKDSCYSAACIYSVIDNKNQSMKFLRLAFENGYKNWEDVGIDPDLKNLRKHPMFKNLLKEFKERSPASMLEGSKEK